MKLKAIDWVTLRSLYLLLAIDTSASHSPEVRRIIDFCRKKYGKRFYDAIDQLAKDNAIRGTFESPDVEWARALDRRINIG